MRWSHLKGQQWGGTTLPVTHDGHFYNAEIKVSEQFVLKRKNTTLFRTKVAWYQNWNDNINLIIIFTILAGSKCLHSTSFKAGH